jgi:hypothetical protein
LVVFGEHIVLPYTLKSVRLGGLLQPLAEFLFSWRSKRDWAGENCQRKEKAGFREAKPGFIRSIVQPLHRACIS